MRFIVIPFFLMVFHVVGQVKKERVPSYFGFQVKPILPTRFIGEPSLTQTKEGFTTTLSQKVGYSFGGVVRVGLTNLIALETGINFNQRNFDIDISHPDSSLFFKNDMSFVTYDIPIKGLIYIRLAEQAFMNTAIGVNLSYNPTNIGVVTPTGGLHSFRHTGLAKKVIFELNAAIGFEYRTEKSGFFYLGATGTVPFAPIFYLRSEYDYQGTTRIQTDAQNDGRVDGSYLAIEFKYFFPNIKKKGQQFLNGPIEQ